MLPMLKIESLSVAYGDFQVLWDVSLEVRPGEIVALLGPNGAGKSTLLNSVSGLVRPRAGASSSTAGGSTRCRPITGCASAWPTCWSAGASSRISRCARTCSWAPTIPARNAHRAESLDWVETLFPRLRERRDQLAHTLSGGEQQMVAIGRGLMARPRFLLVDEPTLGLAPRVVTEILDVLRRINREQGITVLFIEQNVELALSLAHRGYVLESGRVLLEGTADALLASGRSDGSSWASDRTPALSAIAARRRCATVREPVHLTS